MKLNWTTIEERKPQRYDGFRSPYIVCYVFACNPKTPQGGVMENCRWNVEKECWHQPDINANFFLQPPYVITHFVDDIEKPVYLFDLKQEQHDPQGNLP